MSTGRWKLCFTIQEVYPTNILRDRQKMSLNKAEKPNRCVRSMPQCPKLYDIKHCNAMYAIMCIEVKVD